MRDLTIKARKTVLNVAAVIFNLVSVAVTPEFFEMIFQPTSILVAFTEMTWPFALLAAACEETRVIIVDVQPHSDVTVWLVLRQLMFSD